MSNLSISKVENWNSLHIIKTLSEVENEITEGLDKRIERAYDFSGWTITKDGEEVVYNPGEGRIFNEDVILNAKWNPKSFQLTYINENSQATTDSLKQSVTINDLPYSPPALNSTDDYTFKNWTPSIITKEELLAGELQTSFLANWEEIIRGGEVSFNCPYSPSVFIDLEEVKNRSPFTFNSDLDQWMSILITSQNRGANQIIFNVAVFLVRFNTDTNEIEYRESSVSENIGGPPVEEAKEKAKTAEPIIKSFSEITSEGKLIISEGRTLSFDFGSMTIGGIQTTTEDTFFTESVSDSTGRASEIRELGNPCFHCFFPIPVSASGGISYCLLIKFKDGQWNVYLGVGQGQSSGDLGGAMSNAIAMSVGVCKSNFNNNSVAYTVDYQEGVTHSFKPDTTISEITFTYNPPSSQTTT